MNVGERIRICRRKRQLTQKKLAEMVGKEASFISHIERNARNVSVRMLHAIAKVLEISPLEILSLGANEFERCVEKLSRLDETNVKKVNDYVDYLTQTQNRKVEDPPSISSVAQTAKNE